MSSGVVECLWGHATTPLVYLETGPKPAMLPESVRSCWPGLVVDGPLSGGFG